MRNRLDQLVAVLTVGWAAAATRPAWAQAGDRPASSASPANPETLPLQTGGVVGSAPVSAPQTGAPELAPKATEQAAPSTSQRWFGLLLTGARGFGPGVRLGTPAIGIDLTAGYRLVLATYLVDPGRTPEFRLLGGFELAASPFVMVYRAGERTELGIAAGYQYNTLLGHGFHGEFHIAYDIGTRTTLHLFIGPTIFPRAESKIRAEASFPSGGSVSSGLAALQGVFAAQLGFFP